MTTPAVTGEPVGSRGEIVTPVTPVTPVNAAPTEAAPFGGIVPGETATTIPVPTAGKPRAIDKIRAAFADKMWAYPVSEWGLTIYFRPLTLTDLAAVKMGLLVDANGAEDKMRMQVRLLIQKARDEGGRPMFAAGDEFVLMNEAHAVIVQRVCNFMYACGTLDPQDARTELGNGSRSATTSS